MMNAGQMDAGKAMVSRGLFVLLAVWAVGDGVPQPISGWYDEAVAARPRPQPTPYFANKYLLAD